jgi:hypothetical protein
VKDEPDACRYPLEMARWLAAGKSVDGENDQMNQADQLRDAEAVLSQATQRLHRRLDQLQFESSFDEAKFVVLDQDGYGFGAQFERRVMGLQLAYMYGRTAVFVNEHSPPYAPCFEPTGRFKYNDIEHLPSEVLDFTLNQEAKVAFFDFDAFWRDPSLHRPFYDWVPEDFKPLDTMLDTDPVKQSNWLDPEFKRMGVAKRLFEGQLLSRFTYLPDYAEAIEATKRRIGFSSPIIGVHIRRGDKQTENPYVPLRRYFSEILRAVEETGINRVFVSSDDPGVFARLPEKDRIEYVYDTEEPRYNNANHRMLAKDPGLAWQETFTALKIFDLLSHCDVIVGQNNAHLTLLAIARNEARKLGKGDYRLTRGDYCERFAYANVKDWGDVCYYKVHRLIGRKRLAQVRQVLRPIKRMVQGG